MSFFLLMVALWFAMGWRRRRGWMWHQRHLARLGGDPRWRGARHRQRARMHELPATPAESRFEALKRRFVAGELTDLEYEREVDALLRKPGGMSEV